MGGDFGDDIVAFLDLIVALFRGDEDPTRGLSARWLNEMRFSLDAVLPNEAANRRGNQFF